MGKPRDRRQLPMDAATVAAPVEVRRPPTPAIAGGRPLLIPTPPPHSVSRPTTTGFTPKKSSAGAAYARDCLRLPGKERRTLPCKPCRRRATASYAQFLGRPYGAEDLPSMLRFASPDGSASRTLWNPGEGYHPSASSSASASASPSPDSCRRPGRQGSKSSKEPRSKDCRPGTERRMDSKSSFVSCVDDFNDVDDRRRERRRSKSNTRVNEASLTRQSSFVSCSDAAEIRSSTVSCSDAGERRNSYASCSDVSEGLHINGAQLPIMGFEPLERTRSDTLVKQSSGPCVHFNLTPTCTDGTDVDHSDSRGKDVFEPLGSSRARKIFTGDWLADSEAPWSGTSDNDVDQGIILDDFAESWSTDERLAYLASAGLVELPFEEGLLRSLERALAKVPLPYPWVMRRDEDGRQYFASLATGYASWHHPLDPSLKDVTKFCRACAMLPADVREVTISKMSEKWQGDASREWAKWLIVEDEDSGREYYWHRETGESMWAHPASVILPGHYLKTEMIKRIRIADYFDDTESCATSPRGGVPSDNQLAQKPCLSSQIASPAASFKTEPSPSPFATPGAHSLNTYDRWREMAAGAADAHLRVSPLSQAPSMIQSPFATPCSSEHLSAWGRRRNMAAFVQEGGADSDAKMTPQSQNLLATPCSSDNPSTSARPCDTAAEGSHGRALLLEALHMPETPLATPCTSAAYHSSVRSRESNSSVETKGKGAQMPETPSMTPSSDVLPHGSMRYHQVNGHGVPAGAKGVLPSPLSLCARSPQMATPTSSLNAGDLPWRAYLTSSPQDFSSQTSSESPARRRRAAPNPWIAARRAARRQRRMHQAASVSGTPSSSASLASLASPLSGSNPNSQKSGGGGGSCSSSARTANDLSTPRQARTICISLNNIILGGVEVDEYSTLSGVRTSILMEQIPGVPPNYRFLLDGVTASREREHMQLASECLPCVVIVPEGQGFSTIVWRNGSKETIPEEASPAMSSFGTTSPSVSFCLGSEGASRRAPSASPAFSSFGGSPEPRLFPESGDVESEPDGRDIEQPESPSSPVRRRRLRRAAAKLQSLTGEDPQRTLGSVGRRHSVPGRLDALGDVATQSAPAASLTPWASRASPCKSVPVAPITPLPVRSRDRKGTPVASNLAQQFSKEGTPLHT